MGTPGQDLIADGLITNAPGARWNRAGIPVTGTPPEISKSVPPDSYEGAFAINTPERVDLAVSTRDKSRVNIKFNAD